LTHWQTETVKPVCFFQSVVYPVQPITSLPVLTQTQPNSQKPKPIIYTKESGNRPHISYVWGLLQHKSLQSDRSPIAVRHTACECVKWDSKLHSNHESFSNMIWVINHIILSSVNCVWREKEIEYWFVRLVTMIAFSTGETTLILL
jgi:hypothetical protein